MSGDWHLVDEDEFDADPSGECNPDEHVFWPPCGTCQCGLLSYPGDTPQERANYRIPEGLL